MLLKSLPLNQLKTLANWKQAPLGTLLQGHDSSGTEIAGMRCEMTTGSFPTPCFLVLDGDRRGALLEDGSLILPVIDISNVVEVCVTDLGAVEYGGIHRQVGGLVCEASPGSGTFVVPVTTSGHYQGLAFLTDASGSAPVGTIIPTPQAIPNMLVLGFSGLAEKA
jgi:hypothetical protein